MLVKTDLSRLPCNSARTRFIGRNRMDPPLMSAKAGGDRRRWLIDFAAPQIGWIRKTQTPPHRGPQA